MIINKYLLGFISSMETLENIREICGYCNHPISIPQKIHEQIVTQRDKTRHNFGFPLVGQYEGFYISSCGYFYCDSTCFVRFTED